MLDLTWLSILHSSWHFSLGLPDPTNILPLLTGFLTFVQMRLAQPADRETLTQATQLMQFVLPCVMALVTIFITAKFASGIALYRAISLLWNSVQQLCINGWGALFSFPRFAVQSVNAASVSTNNVQVQAKQVRRKGHTGRRHTGRRRGR
jgi:hypothetical protein